MRAPSLPSRPWISVSARPINSISPTLRYLFLVRSIFHKIIVRCWKNSKRTSLVQFFFPPPCRTKLFAQRTYEEGEKFNIIRILKICKSFFFVLENQFATANSHPSLDIRTPFRVNPAPKTRAVPSFEYRILLLAPGKIEKKRKKAWREERLVSY